MYSIPATGIGNQRRAAKILLTTESGVKEYEETFEYQVAKPMAVVSPTKMNVFYRGVPNPIDVSVPGFSPEDLQYLFFNQVFFEKRYTVIDFVRIRFFKTFKLPTSQSFFNFI